MGDAAADLTAPVAGEKARPRVDPIVPCLLAWLVPGLGHFYLGRRGRALTFFAVVLATFLLGVGSGGTASVIDGQQPLSYLATFDNVALGPLDLLGRTWSLGSIVYRIPDEDADPHRQEVIRRMRERVRLATFEYGSTYLLTAGLMNILLILDAFDIAGGRKD